MRALDWRCILSAADETREYRDLGAGSSMCAGKVMLVGETRESSLGDVNA